MSVTNLKQEFRKQSYLSHLILESERELLVGVCNAEGYDIEKVEVCVTLNGVVVRNEDLEALLDGWAERLAKQKIEKSKTRVELLKECESLEDEVLKLAKAKLQEMVDGLNWLD